MNFCPPNEEELVKEIEKKLKINKDLTLSQFINLYYEEKLQEISVQKDEALKKINDYKEHLEDYFESKNNTANSKI